MDAMLSVVAGLITAGDIGYNGITNSAGAGNALTGAINTAYIWGGTIGVIVLIISAYFYVTANGNPTNIERAKKGVLASVVGLVVIGSAFLITNWVVGRF